MALTPFRIDIESERDGDDLQLRIGCRVDGSTTTEFEAALRAAEESDAKRILVDMSQVEFMNYKGLSVLYEAHKRWQDDGERIKVVSGSLQVRNLFAMSGLYDRFLGHTKAAES